MFKLLIDLEKITFLHLQDYVYVDMMLILERRNLVLYTVLYEPWHEIFNNVAF